MAESIETLVIGGGAVGLAVARSLARAGREVLLVEQAQDIGTETSSRNSEVVHAGIYYPPGSLKARLCVEGREALYRFCDEWGVVTKRLGKLIVATTDAEIAKLLAFQENARASGVNDVVWMSSREVEKIEPEIVCRAALLSPSTGILDSGGYMLSLLADAEQNGATVVLRTKFLSAQSNEIGFMASLVTADGELFDVACRSIVNCAGHGAHAVAAAIAGYGPKFLPPRFLAKGSYCGVSGVSPFGHLVYPVPVPGALGVHVTLDIDNRIRLGPNIEWVTELNYAVDDRIIGEFRAACETYWPSVRSRELTTAYCGIRPKIHGPEKASADFVIQGLREHGVAGLVNLFGIESPGLTSSIAIGEYVRLILEPRTVNSLGVAASTRIR
jgi:L-2-hydroxyglutarate oxidase LhgO